MKKYIQVLSIILIVGNLIHFVFSNKNNFLRRYDPIYFGQLYSNSQYVVGELSEGGIGDDGLYSYAGYYYLFHGGDTARINFEHPPLGKYLIGLSIFLFNNENVINLFYFAAILLLTFNIGQIIHRDTVFSLAGLLILTLDPLFKDNLVRSLLDLPFTLFFLAATFYFIKSFTVRKYLYFSNLFWSLAFSTKFFPSFIFIFLYLIFFLVIRNKDNLKDFFFSSLIIPIIYLITHLAFFIHTPSIIEFLRHKKWVIMWWSSSPVLIGNIWRNIITGTYMDSIGQIKDNPLRNIIVPFTFVIAYGGKLFFLKKNTRVELFLYGLTIVYLLYVTFFTGGVQKFIMPIYPLVVILAIHGCEKLYSIIRTWKKPVFRR